MGTGQGFQGDSRSPTSSLNQTPREGSGGGRRGSQASAVGTRIRGVSRVQEVFALK